ncbi:MAG: hypothetical protein DRO88_04010 [Promethearchaeia archaeon]|nr:MAG: hypothetical protein DRO88_04010 [Candidatus Lokiarchaeia archaeon]
MLTPEKMSLLKIAIHKSKIPALLNLVPKYKIHIQEFKQPQTNIPHQLRRVKPIHTDIEEMEQKLVEIEEMLVFYFQKMGIDPDQVPPPEKDKRLKYKASEVKDVVDQLYEDVTHNIHLLKGYINNRDKYLRLNENLKVQKEILKWITEDYKAKKICFSWFEQLNFKLCYLGHNDFNEFEIALEHEEIPLIFEFKEINSEYTAFFLIYHKSHEDNINSISQIAKEIDNYQDYFNSDGLDLHLIEEEIRNTEEQYQKSIVAISKFEQDVVKFRGFLEILKNCRKYNFLEEQFRETYRGDIVRLNGYIPTNRQDEILSEFDKRFHSQIRIYVLPISRTKPEKRVTPKVVGTQDEEYDFSRFGEEVVMEENIPSLVKTPKIFKPFRLLTQLYGVTNYREIDPTPIVALTYPILFGLMFGDVGHGLVLFALGLILILINRKNKESNMYDGGFLLLWLGIAAMGAGFLYGAFFGNDEIIKPLFANPIDDVTKILKASLIIGVIHLSLGLFIQMLNDIQNRKIFLAFVNPFWKILMLWGGAYVIFTYGFNIGQWFSPNSAIPYPVLLVVIPTIPLLIGKPIGKLLGISYLKHESVSGLIGEQAVDVSETYLSMLSNVASYTRLLALAMAHIGLMLVITSMVELFESEIGIIIILIFGNLFVIILESVLAGIHALRLTFYEFFGKFYEGNGIPYEYIDIENKFSTIEFEFK